MRAALRHDDDQGLGEEEESRSGEPLEPGASLARARSGGVRGNGGNGGNGGFRGNGGNDGNGGNGGFRGNDGNGGGGGFRGNDGVRGSGGRTRMLCHTAMTP